MTGTTGTRCGFVPPYLLQGIARSSAQRAAALSQDTLRVDAGFRDARRTEGSRGGFAVHTTELGSSSTLARVAWTVHDAERGTRLPGRPARRAGEEATGDVAVDEAAAGIDATLRLFSEVFGRRSYDDAGAYVSLTVHYREHYDNAFWDGHQLVFGDGDGEVFDRFTKPVDVLAHEFGHAVVDGSARLVYADQSGALNESVADVFAACLLQWLAGQEADEGSWLVGEGLFLPGIRARALRDMAAPGTAYDDPVLGRDPQVGHLDDLVVTTEDNGGVHLNSGIPNRAFHLAATRLGGRTWERAGQVWYAALVGDLVGPRSDFAGFAAATVAAAAEVLDDAAAAVVADAWTEVGVVPAVDSAAGPSRPRPTEAPRSAPVEVEPVPAAGRLCVRRSGGFTGLTTSAELDLAALPPEVRAGELAELVDAARRVRVQPDPPVPDAFVYTFELPGLEPLCVPETALTGELRRLADLVAELGGPA
ncbi:protealysin inhibitor emfourin [Nocardioides solisilvae]|uniref:protealysin inhibitor emfourin n=1 Tax=Nocardioides solisilvae TaxID=1542435 RepID=UPI000D750A57|nr:protealysin inhibitor emfourin [Nocardioides solisilvae]